MSSNGIGNVIKVMGYRPPGMYERREVVLTDTGIYTGTDGGNMQPVTDAQELRAMRVMLAMQNPHKIQV